MEVLPPRTRSGIHVQPTTFCTAAPALNQFRSSSTLHRYKFEFSTSLWVYNRVAAPYVIYTTCWSVLGIMQLLTGLLSRKFRFDPRPVRVGLWWVKRHSNVFIFECLCCPLPIFYFPNGRYIDCLSLTYATNNSQITV